jgi:hypothetical protein
VHTLTGHLAGPVGVLVIAIGARYLLAGLG